MKGASAPVGGGGGRRPAPLGFLAVHLFVPPLEARFGVPPVPAAGTAAVTPSPPAPERAAEQEEDEEDEQKREEEPEPAEEERVVVAVRGDRGPRGRETLRDSQLIRSEERRVGKECRSRWSP